MNAWFWYAIGAALLYGLHQVFTKLAAPKIGDGPGGFVVEGSAALTIAPYLTWLWFSGNWDQKATGMGVFYSVLTGLCVGVGTILFFLLFQKGGPLSAVPVVLAGGAALMAIIGIVFSKKARRCRICLESSCPSRGWCCCTTVRENKFYAKIHLLIGVARMRQAGRRC